MICARNAEPQISSVCERAKIFICSVDGGLQWTPLFSFALTVHVGYKPQKGREPLGDEIGSKVILRLVDRGDGLFVQCHRRCMAPGMPAGGHPGHRFSAAMGFMDETRGLGNSPLRYKGLT